MEQDLGFKKREEYKLKEKDIRCDFYLMNRRTNHTMVFDISVTHPMLRDYRRDSIPLEAAEKRDRDKLHRYVDNYHIAKEHMVPLVFETTGGWSKGTYKFFKEMAQGLSKGDDQIASQILQRWRHDLAVTLKIGQGIMIHEHNKQNRMADVDVI